MLPIAPIHSDRARWHYLFPEGLRERYPRMDGKVEETLYTPKVCQRIVETFGRVQDAGASYGMPPQPLPVQLQHAGVMGSENPHDRRRVGSCYALHYNPKGGAIPAGVWGLVEWTPEGWELVSTRKYNTLSPTTSTSVRLADGTRIPGPAVVEIGLVDVPYLEQIGTVQDCLPASHFPYVGPRKLVVMDAPVGAAPRALRQYPPDLVLVRGAIHRSEAMDPTEEKESVELELSPDRFTPELVKAIMETETARAMCRAMCREYMEAELEPMLEARGYMKREAMSVASPTMPIAEMVAPDAVPASEMFTERAKKAEREMLEKEALDLVAKRQLLAARAGEFVTRRAMGQDVSALLGDYSPIARMAGTTTGSAKETPPLAAVTKRSADTIMAEVQTRLTNEGTYTYKEHRRVGELEIARARAAGALLEG